jgi:hypothetical protein
MSTQKIEDMKARLAMTFALYCYGELEPSDDKYRCHIDKVEKK